MTFYQAPVSSFIGSHQCRGYSTTRAGRRVLPLCCHTNHYTIVQTSTSLSLCKHPLHNHIICSSNGIYLENIVQKGDIWWVWTHGLPWRKCSFQRRVVHFDIYQHRQKNKINRATQSTLTRQPCLFCFHQSCFVHFYHSSPALNQSLCLFHLQSDFILIILLWVILLVTMNLEVCSHRIVATPKASSQYRISHIALVLCACELVRSQQ